LARRILEVRISSCLGEVTRVIGRPHLGHLLGEESESVSMPGVKQSKVYKRDSRPGQGKGVQVEASGKHFLLR
jgi:hypothetical protein